MFLIFHSCGRTHIWNLPPSPADVQSPVTFGALTWPRYPATAICPRSSFAPCSSEAAVLCCTGMLSSHHGLVSAVGRTEAGAFTTKCDVSYGFPSCPSAGRKAPWPGTFFSQFTEIFPSHQTLNLLCSFPWPCWSDHKFFSYLVGWLGKWHWSVL